MIILTLILLANLPLGQRLRITYLQSLPLAFCLITCFVSVLLTSLSIFGLVTPWIIRTLMLGFILSGLVYAYRHVFFKLTNPWHQWVSCSLVEKLIALYLCTILSVTAFNAIFFPPSNWDSMAYHMSRVAFWFQNQSVFPYITNEPRQNQMTPGAEFLILIEQLIWKSDQWANSIQLTAFLTIGLGVWGWFSAWGLSRLNRLALLAVFFAAPMLILQAQTTQNDLAASVPTLVIVLAVVDHFLNHNRNISANCSSYIIFGIPIAISAGYMIKPTSLLVSAPFLLAITPAYILTVARDFRCFLIGITSLLIAALTAIPEITIKLIKYDHLFNERLTIPNLSNPREQFFNSVRHLADHVPQEISLPAINFFAKVLQVNADILTRSDLVFSRNSNEDYVGNPVQFIATLIFLGPLLLKSGRKRLYLMGISLLGAWILFHAVIKNQEWTSRLQTPWFVAALVVWGLAISLNSDLFNKKHIRRLCIAFAFLSLTMSFYILQNMTAQRLYQSEGTILLSESQWFKGYYLRRPRVTLNLDNLKQKINECDVIYIRSRKNQYDYPIAWEAIKLGKRVEHDVGNLEQAHKSCTVVPSFPRKDIPETSIFSSP